MRLDKYIWAIRLYKTKSEAATACKNGRVLLNDQVAKASKVVKTGDHIEAKLHIITRSFKVLDLPKNRVGAKLVPEFAMETTSKEEQEKLLLYQEQQRINKKLGIKGRPTKKERRDIKRFLD